MIQFDTDGVTLFYIDATGNKISQSFMSGQAYSDMLQIRDEQLDAARVNTQAQDNYNTALSNAQVSVNAGKGGAELAPPKPTMKVVSDTGVVTFEPFEPPLADLVMPTPVPQTSMVDQIAAARAATPDKQAIMYNMILAMFRKEFPGA
jgi:hypothetical protein